MSFSSRRRNYMLVSHRRDQFIEFIKGLLQPSFVLDALAESASNSWAHVEELVEEYRHETPGEPSRLRTAVPSLGIFHTALPLEAACSAKFPTSKAPLSAVFHSFRLIFGRAIISRNGLEA